MNHRLAPLNRLSGPLSDYTRHALFLNMPTRALRKFIHGSPPRWLPPKPHLPFARRMIRLKTIFLLSGLCTTAYFVHQLYDYLTLWPPEVRDDLRAGLMAEYKGNLETSEGYLQRAWTTAKSLPISLFASEPHLKISGIAVCLASVLEQNHNMERAFEVYEEALEMLPEKWEDLNEKEKLRAIGIAYKLGGMASKMKGKEKEEEGYLAWAVEALLKDNNTGENREGLIGPGRKEHNKDDNDNRAMKQLKLPDWANKVDVAAPFEALASFYARTGRLEYAMVLYLHAISVLVPPPPQSSSVEDRCRGAQLMTALSDLIMRNPDSKPVSNKLHQAELWSQKALDISMRHSSTSVITNVAQNPTCHAALAVAAYNIGILKQMLGDKANAKSHFEQSLKVSKLIGMEEGIQNAEKALKTVDKEGVQQ